MYTQRRIPLSMPPEHLDAYLARGWYRMGQMIFTCQFLGVEASFFSTIWLRLDLNLHQNSKSQRKLLRKNAQQFRFSIQPAQITKEKEKLFQRYRVEFDGYLSPTLRHSLQDNTDHNIYNTYEVTIYEGDKLVAFSFFDLGYKSIASIKGVYDPEYKKYSLGYYTMLLEMEFGTQNGYDYYYPGYIVPGYSKFDYKTRIGNVDYYEYRSRQWKSFDKFSDDKVPMNQLRSNLQRLEKELDQHKITYKEIMYPLYEANMMGYWEEDFFEHPISLICFPEHMHYIFHAITYDLQKGQFVLYKCMQSKELTLNYGEERRKFFETRGVNLMLDLLLKREKLLETNAIDAIINSILPYKNQLLDDDFIEF